MQNNKIRNGAGATSVTTKRNDGISRWMTGWHIPSLRLRSIPDFNFAEIP